MKKGLIGAILAAFVLVFASGAMATDVDFTQSGTIEFKITGTSAEGACSGLFGAGDVLVDLHFVATCGSWELNVSPELDIGGGAMAECDAYITYHGSMFDFTMYPTGVGFALYDIYGAADPDDEVNIPSKPGIKVVFPLEMATLSFVVNNQCGQEAYCNTIFDCQCDCYSYYYDYECWCEPYCDVAWSDGSSVIFNLGGSIDFALDPLTFGIMFNSNADKSDTWYGNAFGAKASFAMDPLTFIAEYGTWTPDKTRYYCSGYPCYYGCELVEYEDGNLEAGTGYYVEMDYDAAAMGSFVFSYNYADEALNGAGYPTPEAYSKLYFEYSYPLSECVNLVFDVTNTNNGFGGDAVTDYEGKISCSF